MCGRSVRTVLAPAIANAIPVTPAGANSQQSQHDRKVLATRMHRVGDEMYSNRQTSYALSLLLQLDYRVVKAVKATERFTLNTCTLQQCSPVPAPKSTAWTSCHCPKGGCLNKYSANTKALCQTTRPTLSNCSSLLSVSAGHQNTLVNRQTLCNLLI